MRLKIAVSVVRSRPRAPEYIVKIATYRGAMMPFFVAIVGKHWKTII
jgi:hypothetical protein